jgi:DNA-binding LacI/PurR family transcriptional regulator
MSELSSKRVSVKDVARLAKVSVGTVSNYLNETKALSPAARGKIEAAIAALGYRRNRLAISLRTSRTQTLGMIVPSIANPFYTSVFEGAEQAARESGYTLALGVTHYEHATLIQYLDSFRDHQVDGIIVNGYRTDFGSEALVGFSGPVVVIEPPVGPCPYATIQIDNFSAGRDAVRYLIGKGHTRIAIVPSSPVDPRFEGYKAALKEAGLPLDPKLIHFYGGGSTRSPQPSNQEGMIRQGEAVMNALLDAAPFTACFFTLDIYAVGALKALQQRGISVPDQIAVMGFDDIPIVGYLSPGLTTVAQPHHEMGELAVRTVLEQLQFGGQQSHFELAHRLVLRQSA